MQEARVVDLDQERYSRGHRRLMAELEVMDVIASKLAERQRQEWSDLRATTSEIVAKYRKLSGHDKAGQSKT